VLCRVSCMCVDDVMCVRLFVTVMCVMCVYVCMCVLCAAALITTIAAAPIAAVTVARYPPHLTLAQSLSSAVISASPSSRHDATPTVTTATVALAIHMTTCIPYCSYSCTSAASTLASLTDQDRQAVTTVHANVLRIPTACDRLRVLRL
jgi:hypothetical protein